MISKNIIEPSAPILVESLRAFGYSLETAISDLIDNSISASADKVWLDFYWLGRDSKIVIMDNGLGIKSSEINQVMKFGSQSPDDKRENKDLGRFGLGLKTASLSQSKRFTVCSKTDEIICKTWDVDHIKKSNNWEVLDTVFNLELPYYQKINSLKHGTLVLWENMDKVVFDQWKVNSYKDECKFIDLKKRVKQHLEMVFHRFLEGPNPQLTIYIDNKKIKPWDPFFEIHTSTERTPEESIIVGNEIVKIKGFILPHKDRLTVEEFEKNKGIKGWTNQQGFYIYRNKRMLVAGSWLGLGDENKIWTKEEQYKLARIRIDIPNTLDLDWDIDVKKSKAKPPQGLKSRIISLAQDIRSRAREVFAHRGQYKKRSSELVVDSIWQSNLIDGKRNYFLDRKHTLIKQVLSEVSDNKAFNTLLTIIEQTVPIERIWLEIAEKPESHMRSFEDIKNDEIYELAKEYYNSLTNIDNLSREEAIKKILNTDGFRYYENIIKQL